MTNDQRHTLAYAIAVICFLVGCGGGNMTPLKPNVPLLTSSQIFSNNTETWVFVDGYSATLTIQVTHVDDNHTTWHYTKKGSVDDPLACRSYWGVTGCASEDWFDLEKDTSGNWYSTGGRVYFPNGCQWCNGPLDITYSVGTATGFPRPYLILPAKADFSYQTQFDDFGAMTVWKTSSYMEYVETPMFIGYAYVSDQWEGPCVHEKWYFAPNLGMVKILPLDKGDCRGNPPEVATVRVK